MTDLAIEHRSLDQLAAGAAAMLSVDTIAISLIDANRQFCIGAYGFDREDRALSCTFCLEVAVAGRPIIIQDARSRPSATARLAWGVDLVGYAGVPLSMLDGTRRGAIGACVPVRRAWQDRDLAVLRAFGDAATIVLELELQLHRALELQKPT